ncbi:energy-coupling factor ABC transporter ATP-binding protein [Alkalihalobacterium chitinilyticum]|uniref:Energy-coupling factor transporter ATP-binding protein EcfA2 n=1 Tax=Alkalihalobacterium chitinilyticum TaxID=2980103 RepID=A0ABT5VK18_9BACI|nr:energy-coupling factor ABC transporter ATP-binding protein [Alkalihalobacterium chitinilyticum]MDE5415790.1 energy-coupling factor ABC transporter ATP-binding protein [Alkalihalobacterium chitinilyticum]
MEIKVEQLGHTYMQGTPFVREVLKQVSFQVPAGSYTAIIGHTGSGKSTLIQHLNGLLRPTQGRITIGNTEIIANQKAKDLKNLRKNVGLVFQYPEHQLFEETVEKDIIFGPLNFGVPERVAKQRAKMLMPLVGLSEEFLKRSPFELSGGQKRRVAIAGVLALEPKVLVLDEPTAGLDPKGRREIMDMFYRLHQENQLTTVLVTHHMEDAALYADQIIVMNQGEIVIKGRPEEVFSNLNHLQEIGLDVPETLAFMSKLEKVFQQPMPRDLFTVDQVAQFIKQYMLEKR